MSEYIFQEETMTNLANAFRYKTKDTANLSVEDMRKLVYLMHYDLDGGVTFYDYNNEPVYSYSIAEANALAEMPVGNDIPWFAFIKWSHTLDDINSITNPQTVTAVYEELVTELGFITQTAKQEMWFYVDNFNSFVSNLRIDWGDGEVETLTIDSLGTLTLTHKYNAVGNYIAKLYSDSSCLQIRGKDNPYLNTVILGRHINTIKEYAFSSCTGLESVIIPDGATNIEFDAFRSCRSLKRIVIPDSVTTIENGAFRDCSSLESIVIGSGVTVINAYIFSGCDNLTTINYCGSEEQWNAIVKDNSWDSYAGNATIVYNYSA